MSTFRPLPPRPNLEHARKEAKALLRRLRSGDAEALDLARKRHPAGDGVDPAVLHLADAQLITARDYGFASWPRLVRYFEDVNRQQYSHHQLGGGVAGMENIARSIVANHAKGLEWACRALAAFVPRFYGRSVSEMSGAEVSEEEARLAAARMFGAPGWEVLLERLAHNRRNKPELWEADRSRDAWEAIRAGDLARLESVVEDVPDLLAPSDFDISANHTLMNAAIWKERRDGPEAARPIIEWLEQRGFDRQRTLNRMLLGGPLRKADDLQALLDQGADPNAIEPSGIPIFEIALLRWWNREAIDFLATRVKPRDALWIAAALGDLEKLASFFGPDGRLLPHARTLRPDWIAAGLPGLIALPDPEDEELLLEALNVAMLYGRGDVIRYLAERGAPLDSLAYSQPLLNVAIGNGWIEAAEALIQAGASLDVRGYHPDSTPREMARSLLQRDLDKPEYQRIAELCGVDVDAVVAEHSAAVKEPEITFEITKAIEVASDDAIHMGQDSVTPENLLMGLLRSFEPTVHVLKEMRFQVDRFRADRIERFTDAPEVSGREQPPLGDEAGAAIEAAVAVAREKKREYVTPHHLLIALIDPVDGPVHRLLCDYGFDSARFREMFRPSLD